MGFGLGSQTNNHTCCEGHVLRFGPNELTSFLLRIMSAAHTLLGSSSHRREAERWRDSRLDPNTKPRDDMICIHSSTSLSEASRTQMQIIKLPIPGFALDGVAPELLQLLQTTVDQCLQ